MLNPADALKIECKFVKKVLDYIDKRKYVVDVCPCVLHSYFLDFVQLTQMEACLEYEDECKLTTKAGGYDDLPDAPVTTTLCADQAEITLASSVQKCNSTISLDNQYDSTNRPLINLADDTIYQDATILVKASNCSGEDSTLFHCGCTLDPLTCDTDKQIYAATGFELKGYPQLYPNGYVKSFVLHQTDDTGTLVNTPISVDISPSNLATWTACGTCSAINGADLLFGANPDSYKDAWETLMENVSMTLFDEEVNLAPRFAYSLTGANALWFYLLKAKHNPSGVWMGFNRKYVNNVIINTGTTDISLRNIVKVYGNATNLSLQQTTLDTPCGSLTVDVTGGSGLAITTFTANTNFHYLETAVPTLPLPISFALDSGFTTCTIATLTATYTLNSNSTVSGVEWLDPGDSVISETDTVVIDTSNTGTYTFYVYLENGCTISKTIDI